MAKRMIAAGLIALGAGLLFAGDTVAQSWGSTPPPSAMVFDDQGNVWMINEGPRVPGSSLSSYRITGNPMNTQPLPPGITPHNMQRLHGDYYMPRQQYLPQMPALPTYNPMTGRIE